MFVFILVRFHFCRHLEPRPAVRRAVAGLPRLEPGWERLQGERGEHKDGHDEAHDEQDQDNWDDDGGRQSEQ